MTYGISAAHNPHATESAAAEARHRELTALGLYAVAAQGNAQPFAIALAIEAYPQLFSFAWIRKIGLLLLGLFDPRRAAHVELEEKLGVELPLAPDEACEIRKEVARFKWLEAERAGRDIWAEQNPLDPDRPAANAWFRRHFAAWYLAKRRHQRPMMAA